MGWNGVSRDRKSTHDDNGRIAGLGMSWPAGPRRFETTRWTLVFRSGHGAPEALAALCQAYWVPVYSFIRSQGLGPQHAEDVTQGFFTDLLDRKDLARVKPTLGKCRSWLRRAAKNYMLNDLKNARAEKRGGGQVHVSIDAEGAEESLRIELPDDLTADQIFDRRWALTVIDRAIDRTRRQYDSEGRSDVFARFQATLADPDDTVEQPQDAREGGPTPALVADQGRDRSESSEISPVALRVRRHRLKVEMTARYRRHLRAEVTETVLDPDAVDDEIRHLLDALA